MYLKIALIALFLVETTGKLEIFPRIQNFVQTEKNKLCKIESNIYKRNLENHTVWAHKMLDSSAKGTFGVLKGNDYQLGNYEECLNTQGPFLTQYCLVGLTINIPASNSTSHLLDVYQNQDETVFTKLENVRIKTVKLGMCFPSSCSASDIQSSLTKSLNNAEKPLKTSGITYNVTSTKEFCSNYIYPKKFGELEIIFCILTVVLLILVFIGTTVDCMGKTEETLDEFCLWKRLCESFSARKNWNELFNTYGNQKETRIFDGVRSISIICIFIGHFAATIPIVPCLNGLTIDEHFNSRLYYTVEQLDLIVDTFFVMSGLLLVHGILKKWKEVNINPILLIFLRYVRLTPLNGYVTLYFVTLLIYLGSGPVWNISYMAFIEGCDKNKSWWLNFFYINNFVKDSSQACNFMTWYICCDFQLFILGVLVMFIMQKNLRAGYAVLGLLFILSIIATFSITVIYKFFPHMGIHGSEQYKNFWNNYYVKPYTRASSYTVGMFGGILYDKLISKKVKIPKMISYMVTGISLLAIGGSFAYLIFMFNGQENYKFEFALYNALHRPIWCMGVLGIFTISSFGSIPAMGSILSWSFWTPIAKLCYGFYLIHFMVQISTITTSVTIMRSTLLNTISLFIATIVTTLVLASFLYIVVEAPFVNIFKSTLLRKLYDKKPEKKSDEHNANEESVVTEIE